MSWRRWICGGLIAASASAFGVSRVGPGTLSNDDMMFETATPMSFAVELMTENGDVRMVGPTLIQGGALGPQAQYVQIFMLPNERPDLIAISDRTQMETLFASAGWTKREHADPCVDWFVKDNGETLTSTLVWGNGHGVIFTGGLTPDVMHAIEDMSAHVQVIGACGWK